MALFVMLAAYTHEKRLLLSVVCAFSQNNNNFWRWNSVRLVGTTNNLVPSCGGTKEQNCPDIFLFPEKTHLIGDEKREQIVSFVR